MQQMALDINAENVIEALKVCDSKAMIELSQSALQFQQEALIPILIRALDFCQDPSFKSNLLKLMAIYHGKYLFRIISFENDADQHIKDLVINLQQSIRLKLKSADDSLATKYNRAGDQNSSVSLSETKIDETKIDFTDQTDLPELDSFCEAIQAQLSDTSHKGIEKGVDILRLEEPEWSDDQRTKAVDFLFDFCLQNVMKLSEASQSILLKLIEDLNPAMVMQLCMDLLKQKEPETLRRGILFLGLFRQSLLLSSIDNFRQKYDQSSFQQGQLQLILEMLREFPKVHIAYLNELIKNYEHDKVLIKEISEAYKWKSEGIVPTLLTWMSLTNNEDLKFRIVRSIDRLVTINDIQYLKNAANTTDNQRDRRILNNIFQLLESKSDAGKNTPEQVASVSAAEISSDGVVESRYSVSHYLIAGLALLSFVGSALMFKELYQDQAIDFQKVAMTGPQLVHFTEDQAQMYEAMMRLDYVKEVHDCRVQLINKNPMRILCEGLLVNLLNSPPELQSFTKGDYFKVRLSNWKIINSESLLSSASVELLLKEPVNILYPYVGPKIQ